MRFLAALIVLVAGLAVASGITTPVLTANDMTAVLALYNALGGPSWTTQWNVSPGFNKTFCGSYSQTFVQCNSDGSIHTINLSNNNAIGSIPTEIGLLRNMSIFQVQGNTISGALPTQIGQCSYLYTLNLASNQFIGTFPTEIGLLTNMNSITINNNGFSGAFPQAVASLPKCVSFIASVNSFTQLPATFGTHTSTIRFENNLLTQQIPGTIFTSSPVTEFRVSSNQITGTIPTEVAQAPLIDLFLWSNNLTGPIPTQLGTSSIQRLWAYSNALSGSLPTELGGAKSLIDLRVMGNLLTGIIPTQIASAPLQYLWVANNVLSGTLPSFLFGMSTLASIRLNSNQISGSIPSSIWTDSALTLLDLSSTCISPLTDYSSIATNDYPSFVPNSNCTSSSNPVFESPLPAATLLQYQFNPNPNELLDLSGNRYDLNVHYTALTPFTIPVAQIGNPANTALVIPSTNIFAYRTPRVTFPAGFTIEALFAIPALTNGNQDLFGFTSTSADSPVVWVISITSSGQLQITHTVTSTVTTFTDSTLSVAAGRMHYLAITNNGPSSGVTFYLDGATGTTFSSVNMAGSFYFEIGRTLAIVLDELYVYKSVLSSPIITGRYTSLQWCLAGACPAAKTCTPTTTGNTCT